MVKLRRLAFYSFCVLSFGLGDAFATSIYDSIPVYEHLQFVSTAGTNTPNPLSANERQLNVNSTPVRTTENASRAEFKNLSAIFQLSGVNLAAPYSSAPGLSVGTSGGSFTLQDSVTNALLLSGTLASGNLNFTSPSSNQLVLEPPNVTITGGSFASALNDDTRIVLDFSIIRTPIYSQQATQTQTLSHYESRITGYTTHQTNIGYCIQGSCYRHGEFPPISKGLLLASTPAATPWIITTQIPQYTQVPIYTTSTVYHQIQSGWDDRLSLSAGQIFGLSTASAVPEPATLVLLGLGGIGFARKKMKRLSRDN